MDEAALLEKVRSFSGSRSRQATHALAVTLATVCSCLDGSTRRALVQGLGPLLVRGVDFDAPPRELEAAAFYARVATLAHLPLGRAVEATQAALEALACLGSDELLTRVRKQLHPSVAERMVQPERDAEAPAHVRHHPPAEHKRGPTLSTGRPGAAHPLAESGRELAHSQSVVASKEPHGDTKLSSARGITQEQDDRTLAEGTAHQPDFATK